LRRELANQRFANIYAAAGCGASSLNMWSAVTEAAYIYYIYGIFMWGWRYTKGHTFHYNNYIIIFKDCQTREEEEGCGCGDMGECV